MYWMYWSMYMQARNQSIQTNLVRRTHKHTSLMLGLICRLCFNVVCPCVFIRMGISRTPITATSSPIWPASSMQVSHFLPWKPNETDITDSLIVDHVVCRWSFFYALPHYSVLVAGNKQYCNIYACML